MKTVIYLDVLLLINFLIGYLLLQTVGVICSVQIGFWRSFWGAAAASCSTLIMLVPELPLAISLMFKLASALLVIWIAFGFCGWRPFFRQTSWFFLMNVILAGLVVLAVLKGYANNMQMNNLSVYINLSPVLLLVCTVGVYLAMRLILFLFNGPQAMECWQLHLYANDVVLPVANAMFDTGFLLQDTMSNNLAILVSYPFFSDALPADLSGFLQDFFAGGNAIPPDGIFLRMIPCKTATGCQTLPAVGGFCAELSHEGESRQATNVLVVFSPQTLIDGSVQALFGKHFLQATTKERRIRLCANTLSNGSNNRYNG